MNIFFLKDISFSYTGGGFELNGISCAIEHGTVTALIGPNAAGKTTLLKLLAGILRPKSGMLKLNAVDIRKFNNKQRAGIISYVPQAEAQIFDFTVREITAMARRPYTDSTGIMTARDNGAVDSALAEFALSSRQDQAYESLSGGEKRMALIARAVAQETPVILMDEPTAFLDIHHQAQLLKKIKEFKKSGKTVVLVSHDINAAAEMCDKLMLMKDGGILAHGNPEQVVTRENIRNAYGFEDFEVRKSPEGKPEIRIR
jgi:iron complex transport system ATP-binding protein